MLGINKGNLQSDRKKLIKHIISLNRLLIHNVFDRGAILTKFLAKKSVISSCELGIFPIIKLTAQKTLLTYFQNIQDCLYPDV